MKKCRKCGRIKSHIAFAKDISRKDGLQYVCRECQKLYRLNNIEHIKKYRIEYWGNNKEKLLKEQKEYNRLHPEVNRKASINYRINHPDKKKAHQILNDAVAADKISKPRVCERCGKEVTSINAHHPDYSKPLNVLWLCIPCHHLLHSAKPD